MAEYLDLFIQDLLHLDDLRANRLLDIGDISGNTESDRGKAYKLSCPDGDDAAAMLRLIRTRRGKPSNRTILRGSALIRSTVENPLAEKWDWSDLTGAADPAQLDKYIEDVYGTLSLKGNNPLFLGVGLLSWSVAAGDEIKRIHSPLLIFPIRFVRGTNTSPVEIEFVDDDAYFNPCLVRKLADTCGRDAAGQFPHPAGKDGDFDEPLELDKIACDDWFAAVQAFAESLRPLDDDGAVRLYKDYVCVAQYNHSDMCMYYDVRRNRDKIYAHPLVRRIFEGEGTLPTVGEGGDEPMFILPKDSVQEDLIRRIAAGESLIVKGPPGTGKTLTIANTIAALLANGKKVLLSSKKIAALNEVYNKLPEPLRKFALLLDYETEQKAAAVKPEVIRAALKKLLQERKEYVYDKKTDIDYERAVREQYNALDTLSRYHDDMFASDVAWGSYYDALDTVWRYESLPPLPFAADDEAANLSHEGYNRMLLHVQNAANAYAVMTKDGNVLSDCPWLGITDETDSEGAFLSLSDIADAFGALHKQTDAVQLACSCVDWDEITLADLVYGASLNTLSDGEIERIAALPAAQTLTDAVVRYEKAKLAAPAAAFVFGQDMSLPCFAAAEKTEAERGQTLSLLRAAKQYKRLFIANDGAATLSDTAAQKFAEATEKAAARKKEHDALLLDTLQVLDTFDFADENAVKACRVLAAFDGKQKAGAFDFKAKGVEKKLRAFASRQTLSFADIVKAAVSASKAVAALEEEQALKNVLARLLGVKELDEDRTAYVLHVAAQCKATGKTPFAFVSESVAACENVEACLSVMHAPDDFTLDEFLRALEAERARLSLRAELTTLCRAADVTVSDDVSAQAVSAANVVRLASAPAFAAAKGDIVRFIRLSQTDGETRIAAVSRIVDKLKNFGATYFQNTFTMLLADVRLRQAAVLKAQAKDRAVAAAALSYRRAVYAKDNDLPLSPFFAPIERGEVRLAPDAFADAFTLSVHAHAVAHKKRTMGNRRNGLGKAAAEALDAFEHAENELLRCNVLRIQNLCMSRIDDRDEDFDFLAIDKGIASSLRVLFRNHADALLKLKRCIIAAPGSASVLMRGDAYEDFDVVIVDEASQMEPVNLLPILFRSKQCVLVGDEFQMPPLTHFKVKNRNRIADEDSELSPDTDISALSLALGNLAFAATELRCHYRSATEALIGYSQHEFYPYMRTFPAAVPFGDDLGFRDIYTPDGKCDGGVNEAEAQAAVECLRAHFDKYYDPASGVLRKSVGVVAFGEAQLKRIRSLTDGDAALRQKTERAIAAFDDVPDKLLFFRTIESVQGQEIEHLILSLTYGKDKNGNVKSAFGELNRDALGKNIFNVAITRAQSMVTLIHSVTPEQIAGNPRVAFIKEYLAFVRRFSAAGQGQFVSNEPEKGNAFVHSVAAFLRGKGIESERIVIGYGVTDGSVRIPVAVLDPECRSAQLGVWCESPVGKTYDFLDYNVRYPRSLALRGWHLHTVFAHEWADNRAAEEKALSDALAKYVTAAKA